MTQKQIKLAGVGVVTIIKRRGTRNIRLSLQPDGSIRVSIPAWAPYQAAVDFAAQKRTWISKHRQVAPQTMLSGQRIGKAHRLQFTPSTAATKSTARLNGQTVRVTHPIALQVDHLSVQTAAHKASLKALRREAEQLLPGRLQDLATKHGFSYKSVGVRQLKTRWGSCSSKREITLNYYLMQLPWQLIDYVLLHELMHTKHLNHSTAFWDDLDALLPDVKQYRRRLRAYRPWLLAQ